MKLILTSVIIISAAAFVQTDISTHEKFYGKSVLMAQIGGQIQGSTFVTEGWIDDNTYRLAFAAATDDKIPVTNKKQRMDMSLRRAVMGAERRILSIFIETKMNAAEGSGDRAFIESELKRLLYGRGKIISKTFDDQDNCEVVYQIQLTGLKKYLSTK